MFPHIYIETVILMRIWQEFLSRAIDPPAVSSLDHALFVLDELGALSPEGDLTPMGQHLVSATSELALFPCSVFSQRQCSRSISDSARCEQSLYTYLQSLCSGKLTSLIDARSRRHLPVLGSNTYRSSCNVVQALVLEPY